MHMRVFKYVLIAGWAVLLGIVALVFVIPKPMGYILKPIADFFVLFPASLLIGTGLYGIIRLYKIGMKRSVH